MLDTIRDPVRQLAGRTVLLAHGDQDRQKDRHRDDPGNHSRSP